MSTRRHQKKAPPIICSAGLSSAHVEVTFSEDFEGFLKPNFDGGASGWFDCVERARAGKPLAGARRFEESGARDRRVLDLLAHALTETSTDMPEALSRGA